MGNWKLTKAQESQALTAEVRREMRNGKPAGLSRRQLIRRSLGAAVGLWFLEITRRHHRLPVAEPVERLRRHASRWATSTPWRPIPAVPGATLASGAPAYFADARCYVQLLDPTLAFADGDSPDGSGQSTNVRALYQRCPHLGCKPNFCTINYWFECPCHGSRYDRLGTKVQELGPAPRSLDRFASKVRERRPDRGHQQDHPRARCPVALGQPGLIPAKAPGSCI